MKSNILVIDDSESIREVVSSGLRSNGYNVLTGVNGANGLEILKHSSKIDVIITDLNMPIMDGITFLKEVRKDEAYRFTPIIVLTTESQEAKKQEARMAGATAWIIKPFSKEKLINVIKKIIY
jgi:two-component system chemotaxis response regulator CheY